MSKHYLIVINDGPYGNERPFNALRMALNLLKSGQAHVALFLIGDAVQISLSGQTTPDGYYNLERMLKGVVKRGKVAT